MSNIRKLLILGATGFLGSALMRTSSDKGVKRFGVGRRQVHPEIRLLDITEPGMLTKLLDHELPSHIVNCAVFADFDSGSTLEMYAVNSLAPAVVAGWAARHGAYFLQVSGTLVHGARTPSIGSKTPLNPDTAYAHTKLLAEEMVSLSTARALRLRVGGIIGIEGPDHLAFNRVLRLAREGIPPKVSGTGAAKRNYIHVDDVCHTLLACLERERTGLAWLGGSEVLTIAEIMQLISETWLQDPKIRYVSGAETSDQIVHSSLGFPPIRSLAEALAEERLRLASSSN